MADFELMVSATHHNFKKLCLFREENLLAHQQKSIHLSLIIIEKWEIKLNDVLKTFKVYIFQQFPVFYYSINS